MSRDSLCLFAETEVDLLLGSEGVCSSPRRRDDIVISASAAAAATNAEIGVEDGGCSERDSLEVTVALGSGVQPGEAMTSSPSPLLLPTLW